MKVDEKTFPLGYSGTMARSKQYTYLVDKLTMANGEALRKALGSVAGVEDVQVKVNSGVVVVISKKDVEEEMVMACSVTGSIFRTKVSTKKASYYK